MTRYQRSVGEWQELFATLYQLAGDLLLATGERTDAERSRMTETLLDALSRPEHFTAEAVRVKHELDVLRDKAAR